MDGILLKQVLLMAWISAACALQLILMGQLIISQLMIYVLQASTPVSGFPQPWPHIL